MYPFSFLYLCFTEAESSKFSKFSFKNFKNLFFLMFSVYISNLTYCFSNLNSKELKISNQIPCDSSKVSRYFFIFSLNSSKNTKFLSIFIS